jgi:hypothetical protein
MGWPIKMAWYNIINYHKQKFKWFNELNTWNAFTFISKIEVLDIGFKCIENLS